MMIKALSVCIFYVIALFPVVNSVGDINYTNSVNCSLYANVSDVKTLQRAFDSHKLFLRLTVSITGDSGSFSEPTQGEFIRTDAWVLAIGDTGKSFLQVHEGFELMSLYTMSFSVQNVNIQLYQSSDDCLQNLTIGEIETKVREFFLNLLDVSLTTDINVCNTRIIQGNYDSVKDAYNGKIVFSCCVQDFSGRMSCENQKPGFWFNVLLSLKVFSGLSLVFILGILLPPWKKGRSSFFQFLENNFINGNCVKRYCCILPAPMRMNISYSHSVDSNHKYPKQNEFKQLNKTLNGIGQESTYQLEVDAVSVSVEATYDITDGIPVPGFFQYLLDVIMFLMYRIYMKNTCDGKVIAITLTSFIAIIVIFPIIIRVIFYFKIDKPLLDTYLDEANKRGYTNVSVTDFNTNIIFIISDIIGICLLLPLTIGYIYISLKFEMSWTKYELFKEKINKNVRTIPIFCCCTSRRVRKNDRCYCCRKSVIVKIAIHLPLLLLHFMVWIHFQLPTLIKFLFLTHFLHEILVTNLKGRLFICILGFLLLTCMFTLYIVMLDVTFFYVSCLTYVVIGVLLNYDQVASYVSFVIVFCFFCIISINSARKPFIIFNKMFINTVNEYREKITDFDRFKRVHGYSSKACLCSRSNKFDNFLGSSNGALKWVVSSELLFFVFSDDGNYTMHMSRRFMNKMLHSEHQLSPKRKFYLIYLIAFRNIFIVFVIFCFLLAITLAFSGGSSPGIITLFSFVSGFSAVSLKRLCSKSSQKKEKGQWKALFEQNLNSKVTLDVSDIHVSKVHVLNNWTIDDENNNIHLYIKEIRDKNGRKLYNSISPEEKQKSKKTQLHQ